MENESINQLTFGELLKTYRKRKHLTQRQLATKLGIHYNTIYRWEQGDFLPGTRGTILEIAKQLDLKETETRYLLEASLIALSPYWYVPYQRNPFFTGREDILQHLHHLLSNQKTTVSAQSHALSGLGGIGKTQIAIEYAYRYAQEYSAVFWVNMATYEGCICSLEAIAECLKIVEKQEQDQDKALEAVKRWLSNHRGWLLILDNVEEIALLKQVLPGLRQGSLLITTHLQAFGTLAQTIEIKPMTQDEGVQFLLSRAKHLKPHIPICQDEYKTAGMLTEIMGGLPLALDQAGAYIEETGCILVDFLHLFQTNPVQILSERRTHSDHPLSVEKTFTVAFENLQRVNRVAANLLVICCLLTSHEIPEELLIRSIAFLREFPSSITSLQFNEALRDLQAFAFISRNAQAKTITIHRLLQIVLKERALKTLQRDWIEHLSCMLHQE